MQVNWFNISIILVLIVIDFYLQKKINEKGYVFLYINFISNFQLSA